MSSALPQALRSRWQPLRLGLVEFFYYDSEEFWFADGHLLLRGNNGTGKSKILSLTLPFLLDANLSASRVEPDGDRSKRMEWNLLVGKHEQRTGYAWIEFGRLDETGEAQFFTLGCGIKAVKDRARTDHWFFHTSQRIGQDLRLISESRVVLGKEALALSLAHHGRIATSGQEHRSVVDEKLFGLGPDRYGALIDTLIQLRQPQLSKKPDEQTLSTALSNALPPLSQALLDGVAESLNQLDQGREELQGIEQLRDAVAKFNQTYRRYAQVLARRQAKVLRQAQTDFDNASQSVNALVLAEGQALQAAEKAGSVAAIAEQTLESNKTQLSTLREDPEARDYASAKEADGRAAQAAALAEQRAKASQQTCQQEQSRTQLRQKACTDLQAQHTQKLALLHAPATAAGLGELPAAWLSDEVKTEVLRKESDAHAARRREQLQQLRARLKAVISTENERNKAQALNQAAQTAEDEAQLAFEEKSKNRTTAAAVLRTAWKDWRLGAIELKWSEPEAVLAAFDEWLDVQHGSNPATEAVRAAHDAHKNRMATALAAIDQQLALLSQKDQVLAEEEKTLREGRPPEPPASLTRDPLSRVGRAGAPLWQVIEFRADLPDDHRAGLEAALQAAGLLDAWLMPDGRLLQGKALDAVLLARAGSAQSLLDFVQPAVTGAVGVEIIQAVLGGIACADDDEGAETWVNVRGRYRLGSLSGRWQKPQAEFIGHAAREAARRRRLSEIAAERTLLFEATQAVQSSKTVLKAQRAAAVAEAQAIPSDEALRNAHAACHAAAAQLLLAQENHATAAGRFQQAEQQWRAASQLLANDARDLRLPVTDEALRLVEQALGRYEQAVQNLMHVLQQLLAARAELRLQQDRERQANEANADFENEWQNRKAFAAEAKARFQALHEAIGRTVQATQTRIAELEDAVRVGGEKLPEIRRLKTDADRAHAAAEEKAASARAKQATTEAARLGAAETLQRFVETELLAVASPDLEMPEKWTLDATLNLARRIEQSLSTVDESDAHWSRVQKEISSDYTELGRALTAQGQQAAMEQNDFGLTVRVFHANRPERPDVLEQRLTAEATQRREILSSQERAVLENHLQSHIAVDLQALMKRAEAQKARINKELEKRPTSTGVRFKLDWEALPAAQEGAEGFEPLRKTLLLKNRDAWSPAESAAIGSFLQARINSQRAADSTGKLADHLAAALDYRRWHRYRVSRSQGVEWKPLAGGAASSGEKALGVTVPMFAAASGHYASCGNPHAPRLVLLDEAFAGIDDEARSHCMGLIKAFDLDFVMTSEREWGCHPTLPGVAIAQLQRLPNVDAVHVSRWRWDGLSKRPDAEPPRSP